MSLVNKDTNAKVNADRHNLHKCQFFLLANEEKNKHLKVCVGNFAERWEHGGAPYAGSDLLDACDYLGQTCEDEFFWAMRGLAVVWMLLSAATIFSLCCGGCLYLIASAR